jgi:hypothetical protein
MKWTHPSKGGPPPDTVGTVGPQKRFLFSSGPRPRCRVTLRHQAPERTSHDSIAARLILAAGVFARPATNNAPRAKPTARCPVPVGCSAGRGILLQCPAVGFGLVLAWLPATSARHGRRRPGDRGETERIGTRLGLRLGLLGDFGGNRTCASR